MNMLGSRLGGHCLAFLPTLENSLGRLQRETEYEMDHEREAKQQTPTRTHRAQAPRLNVELTDKQADDLQRLIPHGHRKYVFGALIDDLIALLEQADPGNRGRILAFIITRELSLAECALGLVKKGT